MRKAIAVIIALPLLLLGYRLIRKKPLLPTSMVDLKEDLGIATEEEKRELARKPAFKQWLKEKVFKIPRPRIRIPRLPRIKIRPPRPRLPKIRIPRPRIRFRLRGRRWRIRRPRIRFRLRGRRWRIRRPRIGIRKSIRTKLRRIIRRPRIRLGWRVRRPKIRFRITVPRTSRLRRIVRARVRRGGGGYRSRGGYRSSGGWSGAIC